MASPILTNKTIASTYKGVLHANGAQLPATGTQAMFDGTGQESALSVGLSGQGATVRGNLRTTKNLTVDVNAGITGILTAAGYIYPSSNESDGVDSVMVLESGNQLALRQLTRSFLGITKERTLYTTAAFDPNSPVLYTGDIITGDILWLYIPTFSGSAFNYYASRISFTVSFHALYSAGLNILVKKYIGNAGGTWTYDSANNFTYSKTI